MVWVSQRVQRSRRRDVAFLTLGGLWGTWTVLTGGPWPLLLVSVAAMLGPGFLRLWLSARGTPDSGSWAELDSSGQPQSSQPGSQPVTEEAS